MHYLEPQTARGEIPAEAAVFVGQAGSHVGPPMVVSKKINISRADVQIWNRIHLETFAQDRVLRDGKRRCGDGQFDGSIFCCSPYENDEDLA